MDEPRLKLVRIESLPAGWLGKSHALWRASQGIDTQWILFLDADCRLLDDHAVSSAVDHAQRIGADLLTLWPKHAAGSWSEALLIPLCAAVMALWFGRSNQNHANAFANGQFLMVRRDAYEKVGGHQYNHPPVADGACSADRRNIVLGAWPRRLVLAEGFQWWRSAVQVDVPDSGM